MMKKRTISILLAILLLLPAMLMAVAPAFAAEVIAEIVETGETYATLQDAVDEVQDGQTIRIMESFETTASTYINGVADDDISYTIDGNGETITVPSGSPDVFDTLGEGSSGVRVLIRDVTVVNDEEAAWTYGLYLGDDCDTEVTLENCVFTMTGGYALCVDGGRLNILSGSYSTSGSGFNALYAGGSSSVVITSGIFDSNDETMYAIYADDESDEPTLLLASTPSISLASGSTAVNEQPTGTAWLNAAYYVEIEAGESSSWSGFSGAPCMLIEVKDASGNLLKETGFVVSRKAGGVVGVNFVSASETKCTDKSGVLGFSGISGMTYIIEKDGRKAEFVFTANKTITVTLG